VELELGLEKTDMAEATTRMITPEAGVVMAIMAGDNKLAKRRTKQAGGLTD
jgi:hypothetical protein